MKICDRLRPALLRSVEADASPVESLRVASHLDRCTACRIAGARARRLSSTLDALQDLVEINDEAFLREVMAALPATPPPPPAGQVARRRLAWIRRKRSRVAGSVLVLLAAGGAAQLLGTASWPNGGALPKLAESPEQASNALSALAALVGVALEGLSWGGRIAPAVPDLGRAAAVGLALAGLAAAAAGAAAVAAALRGRPAKI